MKTPMPAPPPAVESCPTIRLAQGDLAAVDVCSCGMLRLHLAALTLRITPEALASVLETLTEALATQTALRTPPRLVASAGGAALASKHTPRGQS